MKYKNRIRKRVQKALAALLVFGMLLEVFSPGVLAAASPNAGEILEDTQGDPGIQADDVNVEGDGPIGGMVAEILSEEQARTQEEIHIASLSFNGASAAVTYDNQGAEGDCDLVVAVYAEGTEPRQMLASGTSTVSKGGRRDCVCNHRG